MFSNADSLSNFRTSIKVELINSRACDRWIDSPCKNCDKHDEILNKSLKSSMIKINSNLLQAIKSDEAVAPLSDLSISSINFEKKRDKFFKKYK